jgi:sigma-E factor negative regulatory protein RseA
VTDTRKESLSALIDGEASEIEVHRLVREFRADESLSESWAIYQQVRTTVRNPSEQGGHLPLDRHRELFNRISEAVHEEQEHQQSGSERTSSTKVVLGSLALAASLVVAVFLGVRQPEDPATVAEVESAPPIEVQTVSSDPQGYPASELVELDEEKQRRLRAYLNQHDQMARMNADQKLVNYKETPGN